MNLEQTNAIFIKADSSDGMMPEGHEQTMTVKELIEYLWKIEDKNTKIYLDTGEFNFKCINPCDFEDVKITINTDVRKNQYEHYDHGTVELYKEG